MYQIFLIICCCRKCRRLQTQFSSVIQSWGLVDITSLQYLGPGTWIPTIIASCTNQTIWSRNLGACPPHLFRYCINYILLSARYKNKGQRR